MKTAKNGFDYYHRQHIFWDISHYGHSAINFYKLHGSIDWKRMPDGKVYRVPAHDFTRHEDHVIIYPGFKGKPIEEPFITNHNEFKKALKSADVCIVIGFSFRDENINEIISSALKETPLRLLIWNPIRPQIDFPENKIDYFEQTFGDDMSKIETVLKIITSG